MTNYRELTHKEIKMINDLLDGQLPADKAKQAFLQIEQDAALRAAYDKLRWTKSLLRQAPRRRVPHNFTLTRQMAQEATGFYKLRRQTFSIAGAMASFLFVVLLAVQLVPLGMRNFLPMGMKSEDIAMMDEAAAPQMMKEMPEEEVMEAPAEQEEMFAMEAEAPAEDMDQAAEIDTPDMADAAEDEASEERIYEEETSEAEAVGMLPEDELVEGDMLAESSEVMPEEIDETPNNTLYDNNWMFSVTVLAGLLAFVFIFISIRDKNRGKIQ